MTCYTYNGVTLSAEELFDAIKKELSSNKDLSKLAAIVYQTESPSLLMAKALSEGEEARKYVQRTPESLRTYIGVNNFITAENTAIENKGRLSPQYNDATRRLNYIRDHKADFNNNEETAGLAFDEQVALEDKNKLVGTNIHKLLEILRKDGKKTLYNEAVEKLKKDLENDTKLIEALTQEDENLAGLNPKDRIDGIVNSIMKAADKVNSDITDKFGKDWTVYTEMPMLLKKKKSSYFNCRVGKNPDFKDYNGIYGVADLVLLNEKTGEIAIVDYKVCSRKHSEWYASKANEVDYQLAIYRAILSSKGFDGRKIKLYIKPVLFPKQNISALEVMDMIDEQDASWHGANRISWKGGRFTAKLRSLGVGAPLTYIPDSTALRSEIESDRAKIITYEDPKILTKEWFLRNNKIEKYKDGYRFWSKLLGTDGGWVTAKTREEIEKQLDIYIDELSESRRAIAKTIVKEINEFREALLTGKKIDKEAFLRSEKNGKRAEMLQAILGKYTDIDWHCMSEDLPDTLLDMGLLFFSKNIKGKTVIEMVSIAEGPLTMKIDVCGNNYVVGLHLDDEQARRLSIPHVMDTLYRNVKAIEAASILNTLMKIHPDQFEDVAFGNLIVLNPNGEYMDLQGIDIPTLLDNFGVLAAKEHGDIENNLTKLEIFEPTEYVMSEVIRLLNTLKEDDKLRRLLKDIDTYGGNVRAKIACIERLLKLLMERYPECQKLGVLGSDTISRSSAPLQAYVLLSLMYNELHNTKPDFTGRMPKTALTPQELFSALGILRHGTQALTDNTGDQITGFGNGLLISSPRTTSSKTLKLIFAYYDAKYLEIRKLFTRDTNYLHHLTSDYINKVGGNLFLDSSNRKIWEQLLVRDENGEIDKKMLIKNPYDMSNDLTTVDREFLKDWLWEVNKYFCTDPALEREWRYRDHAKDIENSSWFKEATGMYDSRYFWLPLTRSDKFQKATTIHKSGLKNYFENKWKDFEENYDPKRYHDIRKKQLQKLNKLFIDSPYDINVQNRKEYIENVNNPYDFSFDLDFLAMDVAFTTIRKEHFDEAIMLTETMLVVMNFISLNAEGVDFSSEMDVARDQLKIIKGDSVLSAEEEKWAKPLGAVKALNSVVNLGFRPLSFLKEMTFGMITNYSRAWSLKYGSNELSAGTITKALGIVFGERIEKLGHSTFGDERLTDFKLCELINRLYAIANQDLNRTSLNSSLSRVGFFNNVSRYMYIAQSAPDYYNRLTLFIAKMLTDGCFEAHTLDSEGNLHYDWKKDQRFSELAKHGLNSDYASPEYNKQKALYVSMCREFEAAGEDLISVVDGKVHYGDITSAYTANQRASIKEVADTAFGFYDHESKSQINHKFFGLVFLQFQTFLSAKYNLWLKGSTENGRNTAQGHFKWMERNGIKYYERHKIDEKGNYIGTDIVAETELSEEEKRTLLPHMEWEGDFVEGLMYSILYTMRDLMTLNWKDLSTNPQRLVNCLLALHDIFFGIILYQILKFIFSGGSNKTKDILPLSRVFLRAIQDVGPSAFTLVSLTPSFLSTLENIKNDGIKLLVDSDNGLEQVLKHFGGTRDWIWEEQ